jgi:KaiC/GvpD/RAD55 family RecA-like ATPase
MFETKILACFLSDRKDYDNAAPHIQREELSPMGTAFLAEIDSYYAKDSGAERVDAELFKRNLERRFENVPKHKEQALSFYEEIKHADISSINVISTIIQQKRARIGTNLADALLAQDDDRITMFWQEYEDLSDTAVLEDNAEDEYIGVSLDALEEQFDEDGAWALAPKELGSRVRGGLRPGHAVVVAARPERGKTLFGVNFASGFLSQGARVLYIGNEDPVPDLVLRLLSNLTGMEEEAMFANKEKAMGIAKERGYDSCVFHGLSPGTLYEVEALVRKHQPDVVIVDQMRNIKANTENNTQRLEEVAQGLRDIARRHSCVVVSMTQVGDSGRNKLVLNDGDIDGSNTGVPGACDVIVLIGSNEEYELRDLRMLTLAKNKRGGNHDSITVSVNRGLSRVESYMGGT